ncbi:hypothetical protein PVK06_021678 [Gossypium arboreum]|uniref:Uncharacterized protein n=1 Tax=Gossypium arboreum TaxID=29729 RepID=A0ABR0PQM4_GOSAR|nr:hypothetical protein PVK06_021678 [Gossypium arboreum]
MRRQCRRRTTRPSAQPTASNAEPSSNATTDANERPMPPNLPQCQPRRQPPRQYDRLRHKQILPCKCLSIPVLAALNIETAVTDYFRNIGWVGNFDVAYCAYYELVLEFYSTFHLQRCDPISLDTPGVVKFQLLGTLHLLSITDFNIALNFVTEDYSMTTAYKDSLCTFPTDFRAAEAFALLIDNAESTYSPKTSKDLWFRNPALCYIHRYLAYNFSG